MGTGGLSAASGDDGGATAPGSDGTGDASGSTPGTDATLAPPPLRDAAGDSRKDDSGVNAFFDATQSSDAGSQDCNTTCMTQMCANQQAECGLGTDCEAYVACVIGCGASDAASCSDDCEAAHAAGVQAGAALLGCTFLCGIECAAGSSDAGDATDAESSD